MSVNEMVGRRMRVVLENMVDQLMSRTQEAEMGLRFRWRQDVDGFSSVTKLGSSVMGAHLLCLLDEMADDSGAGRGAAHDFDDGSGT